MRTPGILDLRQDTSQPDVLPTILIISALHYSQEPPDSWVMHFVPSGHECQVEGHVLQSRWRQPSSPFLHWRY